VSRGGLQAEGLPLGLRICACGGMEAIAEAHPGRPTRGASRGTGPPGAPVVLLTAASSAGRGPRPSPAAGAAGGISAGRGVCGREGRGAETMTGRAAPREKNTHRYEWELFKSSCWEGGLFMSGNPRSENVF